MSAQNATSAETLRVDKWLWHARFFKSRALAAKVVSDGKLRVNGTPISKPSRAIAPDVVLTFVQGREVRVVKVLGLGTRRGPAPEAQALYEDLDPPKPRTRDLSAPERTGPRPTKKARREMDQARHLAKPDGLE
ncbi:MAG: RNA-binding S4 domain-containing protein [Pseudomonadota bacterium]